MPLQLSSSEAIFRPGTTGPSSSAVCGSATWTRRGSTAAKYLETDPGFSVASWAEGAIKALPLLEKATDMEAYKADLIKAGLPE